MTAGFVMRSERAIPAYTSSAEAISVMEEKKLDTLDLVLRDHEASLDTFIERLDTLIEVFSMIQHRLENLCEKIEQIA